MKKLLLFIFLLSAVGVWFYRGKLFPSLPSMTITASHVLVGNPPGDHALYGLNAPVEIRAASVGYDFNPASMGDILPKLGARGLISFMDPNNYKAITQASTRTGTCMPNLLSECQRNGEIQHLILVPQDAATMDLMKHDLH